MNSKECEKQLNNLIEHFNYGGDDFNENDIEAIKHLMLENQMQHTKINELQDRINKAIEVLKLCNSQCAKETIEILKEIKNDK